MYYYLIHRTSERIRILTEIKSMEPGRTFSVIIIHRCLPRYVTLCTNESEEDFLGYLKKLYLYEIDG